MLVLIMSICRSWLAMTKFSVALWLIVFLQIEELNACPLNLVNFAHEAYTHRS